MAPPYASKKPSTTAAPSKLRQSHTPADEDNDEETHADHTDMADESDDEFDVSQGTKHQKMIFQSLSDVCSDLVTYPLMHGSLTVQQQKKRHTFNKNKVKEAYSATKTSLQDDINKLFDEHEDQSNTAHRAQLARLTDLLALKTSLESQMARKLTDLTAAYDAHSKELCRAVDSRIRELK
ncbi:hypothetical protein N0V95_006430 [Ascochyta clinopodiicola]|nr:hypothetical protein N0V95_006430 [Ascochyta clinopodiicola]